MRRLRAFAAVVLLGATSGCGLLGLGGKLPPRELYRLTPPDSSMGGAGPDAAPGGGAAGVVGVCTRGGCG